MIKAKIKNTGQRIIVRPYSHEFYDFIRCNEDGSIQGTLLRRDELEIIGDKQEETEYRLKELIADPFATRTVINAINQGCANIEQALAKTVKKVY